MFFVVLLAAFVEISLGAADFLYALSGNEDASAFSGSPLYYYQMVLDGIAAALLSAYFVKVLAVLASAYLAKVVGDRVRHRILRTRQAHK